MPQNFKAKKNLEKDEDGEEMSGWEGEKKMRQFDLKLFLEALYNINKSNIFLALGEIT